MRVQLAPSSGVPIYRQIVDQVTYQIASGWLPAGERLPSVRELARQLPANQNTVLKAYEWLEREGLIVRRHGDGTFVAEGGSPLKLAERRRRLGEVLAQAASLAAHFELEPEEVHRLLDEQMARLSRPEEKRHA